MAQNSFEVPDGTSWDGDFGLHDFCGEIPQVQEFFPEANVVLEKYGYSHLTERDVHPVQEISSEVGDDEESVSNSKLFVALLPVLHQKSGMKVSWEDTSINPNMGNFAEELIVLPQSYYQTAYSKTIAGGRDNMVYFDVPKFRLAIGIRPMRMGHSATKDGKASMVGSRNSWIPSSSPFKGLYEVFSLFQDITLGIKRDQRFAYFPPELGGMGKPIPFNTPENFRRFNSAYRQGSYSRLNRELMRRLIRILNTPDGKPPEPDELLRFVSRFKSQYHDWVKGHSIYSPVNWVDCPPELAKYKVRNLEDPTKRVVATALKAMGQLVGESALAVRVEHNDLCKALLGAQTIREFKDMRDRKIAEWKTLSIYSLKTLGYIREISLTELGLKEVSDYEVLNFYSSAFNSRGYLKRIIAFENLYEREAMDEVYRKGPMMVHFNLYPEGRVKRVFAEHRFDLPDTEILVNVQRLLDWWRGDQSDPPPGELITDDDKIIGQITPGTIALIITEDRRLCREANKQTGAPVIRVPVEWYYRAIYFNDGDDFSPWETSVRGKYPHMKVQVFEDTGAIKAAEELIFQDGQLLEAIAQHPYKIGNFNWGQPSYRVNKDPGSMAPLGPPDVFDRRNILGFRRGR
jgi:hypothetical protein